MAAARQGEILKLERPAITVLVLSKDFFNESGMAVVCPVSDGAEEDPLHIPVCTEKLQGVAMLEQLRSLDLQARHYTRLSVLPFEQIQNIADAAQAIFDYYPFSLT